MIRGYPLAVLRETLGWRWAIVLMSVVFGVLHAFNPNVAATAIILVTIAGIFLGAIVYQMRSLWAATAAHFAWNLTLAVFLHAALSGQELPVGDYRVVDGGPDWATGGAWGPEGGVAAMAGMLVAAALLVRRRRRSMERRHNERVVVVGAGRLSRHRAGIRWPGRPVTMVDSAPEARAGPSRIGKSLARM